MVGNPELRIGDAEREATAASLREHYAQGRLSLDELNERLDTSLGAITQGQLDRVTADLPQVAAAWGQLPSAAKGQQPQLAGGPGRCGAIRAAAVGVSLATVAFVVFGLHLYSDSHRKAGVFLLVAGLLILRAMFARIFGWRRGGARRHVHQHHQHGHHHHGHGHGHGQDGMDGLDREKLPWG